jgi:hypothetical protein
MNAEEINNRIQTENDCYNRSKNRLEQKLLDLKQRHQRIISDLQRQKQQIIKQNTNENVFKLIYEKLEKY